MLEDARLKNLKSATTLVCNRSVGPDTAAHETQVEESMRLSQELSFAYDTSFGGAGTQWLRSKDL